MLDRLLELGGVDGMSQLSGLSAYYTFIDIGSTHDSLALLMSCARRRADAQRPCIHLLAHPCSGACWKLSTIPRLID